MKNIVFLFLICSFLFVNKVFSEDINAVNGIYKVKDILVESNKDISKSVFIKLSRLKKGQLINLGDYRFFNDIISRIWNKKIVDDIKINAKIISDNEVIIILKINLNKILTKISFEGITEKEENNIIEKNNLHLGISIDKYKIINLNETIKNIYSKKGYFYPKIEIIEKDSDSIKNGIELKIKVSKNALQKIHKINFNNIKYFNATTLKNKMIFSKELNRKTGLYFLAERFWNILLNKYKFPKDKYIRKGFFKDEFYSFYLNLFGASYNEVKFQQDLEKIKRELYFKNGFIDFKVTNSRISKVGKKGIDIDIDLYEGNPYILNNITWVGNTVFNKDKLNKHLDLKKNKYFDKDKFEKNLLYDPLNSLRINYHNLGYFFSVITPKISKIKENRVDIIIHINEGKIATIDKVNIYGLKISKDRTIRRYLHVIPGEKYKHSNLMKSRSELGRSTIIKTDKFKPFPLPNKNKGTVDLELYMQENLDVNFIMSLELAERGINGNIGGKFNNVSMGRLLFLEPPIGGGQTLTIKLEKSYLHNKFEFSLMDPWLFIWGKNPIYFNTSIWISKEDESTCDKYIINKDNYATNSSFGGIYSKHILGYHGFIESKGFSISLGKRLSFIEDVTILPGISLINKKFKNYRIFYDNKEKYTGTLRDISFSLNIIKDNSDNFFFPKIGIKTNLYTVSTFPYSIFYDIDPTSINNEYMEYFKSQFRFSKYFKIHENIVLAALIDLGFIGNYSPKKGIGPYKRFVMGGQGQIEGYNSVLSQTPIPLKGYPNSFLSPKSSSNFKGGVIFDKLSLELRFLVNFVSIVPFYIFTFIEGGNIWADYNKFDILGLLGFKSYGIGLRAIVPLLGPIRIAIGFGLDRKEKSLSPEIHFGTGLI